jgi:hypothetical protein
MNGENVIRVEGRTQAEAWWRAVPARSCISGFTNRPTGRAQAL